MRNNGYSMTDKKIDAYLGTRNLRPGPPARLINKILDGADKTDPLEEQRINFSSFAVKIERNIAWTELSSVKMGVYGSEPAFFLEFLNNKILILKNPPEIPLYYFGSLIATGLGVKTPKTRIVEFKDPEFPIMMDNLERASHADVGINNKIIHEVKTKPFVILYEYIPSLSLFELGNNRSQILLKEKNFKSREFKVIMSLVAPGANFKDQKVIEIYLQDVYCVDTLPCVLDPNDKVMLKNLGDYLNSLGEFFKLMCYEFKSICIYGKDIESFQFRSFDKLISMFKNTTEYTLSPTNLFHIAMGILIMINTILDIDMESFDKLIKYATKDAISKDWADTFKQYAQMIKTEYFVYMMEFFKKLKDDNDQIFSWIDEITFGIYQCKPSDEILKVVKKHKKYRYDYEELKKKKEEDEASNVTKSMSRRKTKTLDADKKTEKSVAESESGQKDNKSIILERDGFGPLGPQHKGKKNIRDFFNFNKDDNAIFKNDVHNGVYEIAEIDGDMIMGLQDRVYNQIHDNPPKPTDLDEYERSKRNKKKGKGDDDTSGFRPYNDYDPDHKVLTRDELKHKIQNEELFDTLQKKKELNKEEGKFLEEKINEVDPGFEKRVQDEINAEKEKDKKLKENEFNNIKPQGRKEKNTEENSMQKSIVSKKSENKKSESKKSEIKKTEESKKSEPKKTEESKKSKKSKKDEEGEDDEEEEEEEDDEEEK